MKTIDSPLKYLRNSINNTVLVRLKDGTEYVGRLELCDSTMNLLLSDCVEVREGSQQLIAKYGKVLIRGSNILFISTDYRPE